MSTDLLENKKLGIIVTAYEANLGTYLKAFEYNRFNRIFACPTVIVWSGDKALNSPDIRKLRHIELDNENIKLLLLPKPTKCLHARYEGYKRLIEEFPDIELVQFMDCDDVYQNILNQDNNISDSLYNIDLSADIYLSHYILTEEQFQKYLDYRYDRIDLSQYGADCYSIYASDLNKVYKLFSESKKISPIISNILNSREVIITKDKREDYEEESIKEIKINMDRPLLDPIQLSTLFGFGILEPVSGNTSLDCLAGKSEDDFYRHDGVKYDVDKSTIPSDEFMSQVDIGIRYPSIVTMPWKVDLVRETFEYIERNYTLDVNLGEDMLFHSVARFLIKKDTGSINCAFVPPYYYYDITEGSLSEDRSFKTIADLKRIETFVYDLLAKLQ